MGENMATVAKILLQTLIVSDVRRGKPPFGELR
jgi:hypothetical protein